MRNILFLFLILFVTFSSTDVYADDKFVNKDLFPQLKVGTTTKAITVELLGKPVHENSNPNGKSIYFYDISKVQILSLLYDSDKVLVKVDVFERN